MKRFADSTAVLDKSFSAWVGLFLRNTCKANRRVKVEPHYDKTHISWIINEMYKRLSHLRTLDYSSLSLSHTCSEQIVRFCRAQWKHCYPKWIYHLVWLLRLLAGRRRLELFPSDTALCPSVTTRMHAVWEFSMSTGGLFTVRAKRKICQLSPFFHGFRHQIDTTGWTSTNVPK